MFDATEVVPINFVFFTASAIVAGMSPLELSLALGQIYTKYVFIMSPKKLHNSTCSWESPNDSRGKN